MNLKDKTEKMVIFLPIYNIGKKGQNKLYRLINRVYYF